MLLVSVFEQTAIDESKDNDDNKETKQYRV
jgi:hypothetical protein